MTSNLSLKTKATWYSWLSSKRLPSNYLPRKNQPSLHLLLGTSCQLPGWKTCHCFRLSWKHCHRETPTDSRMNEPLQICTKFHTYILIAWHLGFLIKILESLELSCVFCHDFEFFGYYQTWQSSSCQKIQGFFWSSWQDEKKILMFLARRARK